MRSTKCKASRLAYLTLKQYASMGTMNVLSKYLSRNPYSMPRKQFSLPWFVLFLAAAGATLWIVFVQGFAIQSITWPHTTCHVTHYANDPVVTNGYTCEYTVGGMSHDVLTHGSTNQGIADENIGKEHIVFYDPTNPSDGRTAEMSLSGYYALLGLAICVSIALVITGIVAWRKNIKRTRTISLLCSGGKVVEATISGTSVTYAGKEAQITTIHVRPKASTEGTLNTYTSDKVWGYYAWLQQGLPARIFISPTNPHEYYVDIDFWQEYFAKQATSQTP